MRRTREQLRLASKSTAKLNKSERQVIKRFKQREAERRKLVMANNAEQRKRTRKEIKRNTGRTLALLALERLALAGLVQRTSVFVEDETLRYSTRRTRTHLPVKAAETASQCMPEHASCPPHRQGGTNLLCRVHA